MNLMSEQLETLFEVHDYIAGPPRECNEEDAAKSPGVVIAEVRRQLVGAQKPDQVINLNGRLTGALDRTDFEGDPPTRPTARMVIELAIGQSANHGSSANKGSRSLLYNQSMSLLKRTRAIAGLDTDIGDYYTSAIDVAGMYGDHQDISFATETTARFIMSRRHNPELFGTTYCRELRSSLVKLSKLDPSDAPLELLWTATVDEGEQHLAAYSGLSNQELAEHALTLGSLNLPVGEQQSRFKRARDSIGMLLMDLSVNKQEHSLVPRIMSLAAKKGMNMDPVELIVSGQLDLQVAGSQGELAVRQILRLVQDRQKDLDSLIVDARIG